MEQEEDNIYDVIDVLHESILTRDSESVIKALLILNIEILDVESSDDILLSLAESCMISRDKEIMNLIMKSGGSPPLQRSIYVGTPPWLLLMYYSIS